LSSRLLLAGYLGCGNLGDDAILMGLSEGLRHEDFELSMLSGAPEETFRNYGIPSVPRRDLRAVQAAIERCDALVFPGGSVFQDVTSAASPAYYSTLVRKAKKAGKPVLLLGQGVGPLRGFKGKRFAVAAFNAADAIVVRDPGSATTLRNLGVKRPVRVGADMSFLMSPPKEVAGDFQVGSMKTVGISPRPVARTGKTVQKLFGDLSRLLFQANVMPVLIEMDRNEDGPLIYEISKIQGGKVPDIRKLETPMQVQQRMARMESVIAMRLHAGILAANVGVPPLMVSYDPKVAAFAKMLEFGTALSIEGLTAQRLFEAYKAFSKDRQRNLKILERKREELRQSAQVNIEVLLSTLKTAVRA
jgi:polysaccharide pyruvyl transferase CsaB